MQQLLALLPLVLFAVLLMGPRFPASSAGLVSAALALGIAVYAFGHFFSLLSLAGPSLEALLTSAGILWIIFRRSGTRSSAERFCCSRAGCSSRP